MPAEAPRAWLVDTNIISNRGRIAKDSNLAEWFRCYAGRIRLSVVSVAEMRRGLMLLERRLAKLKDAKARAREKERLGRKHDWYTEIVGRFSNRIDAIDIAVAEKWAEISVGFPSLRDGDKALTATALVKGYGIATENLGDFRASGLTLVNPFDRDTWDEGGEDPLEPLLRG